MANVENQQKKDTTEETSEEKKTREYLQSLYKTSLDTKFWENNEHSINYRKFCEEYKSKKKLTDDDFERLFKQENIIASIGQGCPWDTDKKTIKENLKEYYNDLLVFNLKNKEYEKLKTNILPGRKYHAFFNRIISTYFPGTVTNYATIKMYDDVLNYVSKKIPKLETYKCGNNNNNNWFEKNNGLINYFTKHIPDLKDPIHKTHFLNYLYDYFNIIMYKNLLKTNKNLILTGAPGTGKTYLAKQIAKEMIGARTDEELKDSGQYAFVQFHPSFDYTDFVEGLRPTDEKGNIGFKLKDGIFKEFCKRAAEKLNKEQCCNDFITHVENEIEKNKEFNLTDSNGKEIASLVKYEENEKRFKVEPRTKKDTPESETDDSSKNDIYISDEILKKYKKFKEKENWSVKDAKGPLDLKNPLYELAFLKAFDKFVFEKTSFVFIIDEINRGEISKIFGELFFSIDPSYRGKDGHVKTQYANLQDDGDIFKNGFYVPENVYIIGTMNDIDRSVESFDFAMRRRFAWKEIKAIDRIAMWEGKIDEWKDDAETKMNALNKMIEDIPGLSPAFHIGPAYFLHLKKYNGDFDQLWENHLSGLLFEYLRGMPDNITLLGELKKAYDINPEKKATDNTKTDNKDNSKTE